MSSGMGLTNPVPPIYLDRIVREEGLGREHPRKRGEQARVRARRDADETIAKDGDGDDADSTGSTHIDVRI